MSTVYFITYESLPGYVKIGFTTNLAERLKTFQTYNPTPVKVLKTEEGTRATEKDFHKRFEKYKANSEWFHLTDEVLEYIGMTPDERRAKYYVPGLRQRPGRSGYYVGVSLPKRLRNKLRRADIVRKAGDSVEEALENRPEIVKSIEQEIQELLKQL